MKRISILICTVLLLSLIFSGCNKPNDNTTQGSTSSTQENTTQGSTSSTQENTTQGTTSSTQENSPSDNPEPKADVIELIAEPYYIAGETHTVYMNVISDGESTKAEVSDTMFVGDGYDIPNWDVPDIYNVKITYGGASDCGRIVVIKSVEEIKDLVTVNGQKLTKSDSVSNDGDYNQYVDYTDVSKYEMVRINCSLWHSKNVKNHTAIIFYNEEKEVITTYDSSNLFGFDVDIPSLNGGFSYNVDVLLSTHGAKYVRFSNKTATGSEDLNANGYKLISPSLVGYDFGFKLTDAEKVSNATGELGHTAQGGAIYGKYLFQFCDELERIYIKDLETNTVVDTHEFTEKNSQYHCNVVNFGAEIPDGCEMPLLYVSMENKAQHKALVYKVTRNGNDFDFELAQTIIYPENSVAGTYYQNCFIDAENGYMYVGGYATENWRDNPDDNNNIVLKRYPLPKLSDGEVYQLDSNDATVVGTLPFAKATQGGFIKDGLLYQVFGVKTPPRIMRIIDLETMTVLYEFNLDNIGITTELENISYYNGYFYATDLYDCIFRFKFN